MSGDGGFSRTDVWLPVDRPACCCWPRSSAWAIRRPATALVDISLLSKRSVASSSAVMFLSGASLYGSMLLLPLFFQIVQGKDALAAALLLIPQGVGALLSRTLAGSLTDRIGARVVAIVGFVIMGAATVPFALADATTSPWWLMVVLLVRGFGMGAVMIPVMSVAYVGLERAEVAHASIITRLVQQIGGAFGVALLAVILEATTGGANNLADLAHGFDVAFWWAVGFTVVAILVCPVLPARPATAASADTGAAPDAESIASPTSASPKSPATLAAGG